MLQARGKGHVILAFAPAQISQPACPNAHHGPTGVLMIDLAVNHLETVIRALAESGFLFSASDFDERRRAADKAAANDLVRKTLFWCNIAMKIAVPVIESSFDANPPSNHFNFKPSMQGLSFDEGELKDALSRIGQDLDVVAFRYCYSQPLFVGVKLAESLSPEMRASTFKVFDERILDCTSLTSSMKAGLGSVKMSVTGILLWLFTHHDDAKRFCVGEKENLRKLHFWKKVNALSWVVDLESNSVTKHNGLPLIVESVFNVKTFEASLKASDQT
jgi:hypothetical protein